MVQEAWMAVIKKVLVTGASGFLGSHICEALHEAGYEVHALIRAQSSRQWLGHAWFRIHIAELFDRAALADIFRKVDAVIHNAGALWGSYHEVNTDLTRIVAEESVKAGVRKLVYISSIAAGGPSKGPYARDGGEPDEPCSPYGHSKKDAEDVLLRLREKIKVVILRYPMIFGPRDAQSLRLFKSFNFLINPNVGVRHRYISVVYVRDAAWAAVRALEARVESGSIYNISDGANYTFNELYRIAGKVWRRWAFRIPVPFALLMFSAWLIGDVLKGKTAFNPEQIAMFSNRYWLISPRRAIRELDWKPRYDIQDAIRETINWYKKERWL